MANKPKTMHQIRQILEHFSRNTSIKKIAELLGMSRNTVKDYRDKFGLTGLSTLQLKQLSDTELSVLIKNLTSPTHFLNEDKRLLDFQQRLPYFLDELRKTGVTKQLLWQEYLNDFPDGYRYTRFCHFLALNNLHQNAVMRMAHLPGEELQVDFAGDYLHYFDRQTGEKVMCSVLVSVMPYSHFMHAVALPNQKQSEVISGLVQAFDYLGFLPQIIKFDNMKSAVTRPDRYTPEFTEAMDDLAAHYGLTNAATRVAKPRDKASVESAVKICYLRIYGPLRHHTFHSLQELNLAIIAQLKWHNDQLFQGRQYSRRQRFVEDEIPKMKSLPEEKYRIKKCTWSKVGKAYHVIVGEDRHNYSVPYTLIGKKLKLVYTSDEVEVYDGMTRVAFHKRSFRKYGYTTIREHMPSNHQFILDSRDYNGTDFLQEAQNIGPHAVIVVEKMIQRAQYVQHTYQLWQAFRRMKKNYGKDRLEAACKRLSDLPHVTCKALENVLKSGLDQQGLLAIDMPVITNHENLRGAQAYEKQS